MKILLTNICDLYNKGEVALVSSVADNLSNSEITIVPIFSFINPELCSRLRIKVQGRSSPPSIPLLFLWSVATLCRAVLWSFINNLFKAKLSLLLNKELTAYKNTDLMVDLGGDTFSDDYGSLSTCLHCYSLFLGMLFKKPYFICSQSIGPFRNNLTRFLAKFILNRANVISVREPISLKYLIDNLKVEPARIRLIPDLAFLLECSNPQLTEVFLQKKGISLSRPIICVNPSNLIWRYMFPGLSLEEKYETYVRLFTRLIDTLPLEAAVLLIPNVTGRPFQSGKYKNVDDKTVIHAIMHRLKNKSRVYLIEESLDPQKIKSILGSVDLFVGCRMHAVISSLSIGTPTIALSYSHKTLGIIGELLQLNDYIVNVRDKENFYQLESELQQKIGEAWESRRKIAQMLSNRSREWKKSAFANIKLAETICDFNNDHSDAIKYMTEECLDLRKVEQPVASFKV